MARTLEDILGSAFEAARKLREVEEATAATRIAVAKQYQIISQYLFSLAAKTEDHDDGRVEELREGSLNAPVFIRDVTNAIWNGKPDAPAIKPENGGVINIIEPDTIWFWNEDLICVYAPLRAMWFIFGANNVAPMEEANGIDEEKQKLH